MNILIFKFPHNSAFGGGELHTLQLFSALKERGHQPYLVSSCSVLLPEFARRKWPAQKAWMGREPVSISGLIIFTLLFPFLFWRFFWLLLKYKRRHETNKLYCLSLTEKLAATIPAKLLGYSVFWMEHLRIERWLKQNPYRPLYVGLSRLATTIAVSRSVQKQLEALDTKNVKTIYNGIDTEKFKPRPLNATRYNRRPIIGTACRLCPEKGVNYLIKAFAKLVREYPEVELQIAGKGPENDALTALVKKLNLSDKIKFIGFVENAADWLNKIDIFALTSVRRESFGIAVAEASACALPVVVTNISGLTEVVEDGQTGLVVEAKNIDQISSALSRLVTDKNLREKMGTNGRRRIKKKFTVHRMVDQFEKAFADLAK